MNGFAPLICDLHTKTLFTPLRNRPDDATKEAVLPKIKLRHWSEKQRKRTSVLFGDLGSLMTNRTKTAELKSNKWSACSQTIKGHTSHLSYCSFCVEIIRREKHMDPATLRLPCRSLWDNILSENGFLFEFTLARYFWGQHKRRTAATVIYSHYDYSKEEYTATTSVKFVLASSFSCQGYSLTTNPSCMNASLWREKGVRLVFMLLDPRGFFKMTYLHYVVLQAFVHLVV